MRHLFIINPASGKQSSTKTVESLIAQFPYPHDVVYTTAVGDAMRITEEAALRGDDVRIYACGGDGTLNEVVNGAAGHTHVAVTNVPKGTGNDFIKMFGIKERNRFLDLTALADGTQASFDLIDCNGRLALDSVCAGVDARVGAGIHYYKQIPFVKGMTAYTLSLLMNVLFKSVNRHMKVQMGELHWEGKSALLCVCNAPYYGGGFQPVPEAMPDDGILDVLLVHNINLPQFLGCIKKYADGKYRELTRYVTDYHGDYIAFSSDIPITVGIDGEIVRDTSFVITLSKKRVNFFYPNGLSYQRTDKNIITHASSAKKIPAGKV